MEEAFFWETNDEQEQLKELAIAFSDRKFSEIVNWLVKQKYRPNNDSSIDYSKFGEIQLKIRDLSEKAAYASLKECGFVVVQIRRSVNSEVFAHQTTLEVKKEIDQYINTNSFEELASEIMLIEPCKPDASNIYKEYKDNLLSNYDYFINEFVMQLELIIHEKKKKTEDIIIQYTQPHSVAMKRVNRDLGKAEDALDTLTADEHLHPDDKKKLSNALRDKVKELRAIYEREDERLKSVDNFAEYARNGYKKLIALVDDIQLKRNSYHKRKEYLSILSELNVEIPEMNTFLDDLFLDFKTHSNQIEQSLFCMDGSFQESVISAIDEQGKIGRIIFSTRDELRYEIDFNK